MSLFKKFAEKFTKKAESAFQKALAKSPDNANYNYNCGVLYYDQVKDINERMNSLADKINDRANKVLGLSLVS